MELTAESLQQVKFGAKVRGYDPEEVDRFIANVTEIGEELHERLRRATERANKAEQELTRLQASGPAPAAAEAAPAAAAASQQSAELGRVWERAVAAAEGAIEEARQEAQTILEEARRSADEQVSTAQREATRMAEESQSQLRADIARLEAARDSLKTDVDGLQSFLTGEKSRLRASIAKALADIDDYGSAGESSPALSQVEVPPQTAPTFSSARDNDYSQYTTPQPQPEPQSFDEPAAYAQEAPQPEPQFEAPQAFEEVAEQPSWVADQPIEPAVPQWQEPAQNQTPEDDGDPFLAELRRAVRDDGPLGPRDEEENEEDSIDRLYASDDDDKSFFKRKK